MGRQRANEGPQQRTAAVAVVDELRQREGDQPLPIGNQLPSMHAAAIDQLEARLELGIKRYGQPLQPANGRNAALDAWEEALDGAAYGAQVVWEQENPAYTYVGDILTALHFAQNDVNGDEIIIEFGDHFVPAGVFTLLDNMEINYSLPPKRNP